jgi:hypothetical protein
MTPDQIIDLLSLMAARDRRTIGDADVLAWHQDVGDLSFDDAQDAVARHFRDSDEWLTAAAVRRLVKAIRNERITAGPIPDPATGDPAEYIRRLRDSTKALADGTMAPLAITAGDGDEAWDNPLVVGLRQRFEAQQAKARKRQAEQRQAEREATRAYIDAQETLLTLDDLGQAAMTRAWEELFGEEQAAAEFPFAADALGVTDQQKTVIRAAQIVATA